MASAWAPRNGTEEKGSQQRCVFETVTPESRKEGPQETGRRGPDATRRY